ncbi:bleomycin resistance protein [Methylobacterium tarhaniae]|uniref:bleomycin resistance protein n=1 Tax=Methylobacterium tarhaniae TaxID=1187852 RepID=UPI003CFFA34C
MTNTLTRAKLVPELVVADLATSLRFWIDLIGFRVAYDRPENSFAYLDLDGSQVMLDQYNPSARQWLTGPMERPLGRGINFQVEVAAVEPVLARLEAAGWPLFMAAEDAWYRAGEVEVGQRQFLVQDPDGYLLRLGASLGERPVRMRDMNPGRSLPGFISQARAALEQSRFLHREAISRKSYEE